MGCDIHLHIELKINGKWEHYNSPSIRRHYKLFAKMANVRNYADVEPISEPKGIPEDISLVTKISYDRWEGDGHSHSWLSSKEVSELSEWLRSEEHYSKETTGRNFLDLEYDILNSYLFGNSFEGFIKFPEERLEAIEDFRFVFWFDN